MKRTHLKKRLLNSVGATSLGPILTAVIQVVSVPVFLHAWGPNLYGDWLVLSAIPIYLGFTDFGFGSVAASAMTMLVARGDRQSALGIFQSTWLLTTAVSVFFGISLAIAFWALPFQRWLAISTLSREQVGIVLCAFCVYILLDLQWTVIVAGFKCDGNYALGTFLGNVVRFSTNAASVIAVGLHAAPGTVVITLVVFRFLGNRASQIVLHKRSPWLHYGYKNASYQHVRDLFVPAVAYMAFPAGNAFILQGMTIAVGAVLGPVAVVIYSTTRTLTRFVYQTVDMIANSIWAELSAAFGAGNQSLARNLHRCACQASLGLSISATAFLALLGPAIYGKWTHHQVAMDYRLFYLLLIEVLVNAFWFTSAVVPIACNRHSRQALVYVIATAASLPAAYVLMSRLGLYGAGISLLAVDVIMILYVLGNSLSILGDTPTNFTRAMFRTPTLNSGNLEL
jgi:O-antigen/teichoic acid export membrane protein